MVILFGPQWVQHCTVRSRDSKFDQNYHRYSSNNANPTTTIFCTHQHNPAVLLCDYIGDIESYHVRLLLWLWVDPFVSVTLLELWKYPYGYCLFYRLIVKLVVPIISSVSSLRCQVSVTASKSSVIQLSWRTCRSDQKQRSAHLNNKAINQPTNQEINQSIERLNQRSFN